MKQIYLVFFVLLLSPALLRAQSLVSATYLGAKTKNELNAQFGLPIFTHDVRYFKVTYTSHNLEGALDTLSGLVVFPQGANVAYPRLVYQHGTAGSKQGVPSNYGTPDGSEGQIGLVFGGTGYVALLPDYLGLGVSADVFHPYVHAASEAWVAADMLRALPALAAQENVALNDQLFLTGYSQGGHASMALHREIETNLSAEFEVTAAAHLSGPYSISGVMRDLILGEEEYFYPGYVHNTLLSYQTVYGNLFDTLSDLIKPAYLPLIQQFYDGQISLSESNDQLIDLLIANEGASIPVRVFKDSVVQVIKTNPDHPFNVALRDNDVYAWGPQAPTRIFYCMKDDQVPYENSLLARDSLLAYGAANLAAADVNPNADHGGCVVPALGNTLSFFANYQQFSPLDAGEPLATVQLAVSPNPAAGACVVQGIPRAGVLALYDVNGRAWSIRDVSGGAATLDLTGVPPGVYIVRFLAPGATGYHKLVIQR